MIIAVMALAGINQIFFDNDKGYIAKVGKKKISITDYKKLYDSEKTNIQNMLNISLNEDQLSALGFKRIILDKLIQGLLLDNLIQDSKLKIGDKSVILAIRSIKEFQNDNGDFDKERFLSVLNNNNIDESEYVQNIKNIIAKDILLSLFKDLPGSYKTVANKIYDYRFEQRLIDVITVSSDMIKKIPEPSIQDLQSIYTQNENKFWSPEYRLAKYIIINRDNVDDQIDVTDDQINDKLKELESRIDVSYLVLPDDEKAADIYHQIQQKKMKVVDFDQHKSSHNLSIDMLPNTLQEIFSLSEGEISQPMKSSNGSYIFQIEKKYKISQQDQDKLVQKIRTDIINNTINAKLEELINSLEDQLSSAKTIEELTKEYDLKLSLIGPIDQNNYDENGKQVSKNGILANLIFQNQLEEETKFFTETVNEQGLQEYYYTIVTNVISPKLRKFSDCQHELKSLWKENFVDNKLYEMVIDNTQKHDVTRKTIFRMQVASNEAAKQDYPHEFVDQAFHINIGDSTDPIKYQKNKVIVGKLIEVLPAVTNEIIVDQIENQVKKHLVNAMYDEFKHYLYKKYSVTINETFFK